MKRILARLLVILSLWWLAGGLFLVSMSTAYNVGFFELMVAFGFILLPAIVASILVWTDYEIFPFQTRPVEHLNATQFKRKNTSSEDQRLNTLLALMDDDEREAFKEALKDQYLGTSTKRKNHLTDGELPFDAEDYTYDERFSRR